MCVFCCMHVVCLCYLACSSLLEGVIEGKKKQHATIDISDDYKCYCVQRVILPQNL